MRILTLSICYILSSSVFAQNNNVSPCAAPQASQFNFWVGDWNLTWSDSLHGTNHVEKIMDGCTVQENFNDPNTSFIGKSWSVYNQNYKIWQQTWVDNQGGYIDLTGGMIGDSMVLVTIEKNVPQNISPTGKIISRMVYANITKQSFDWNWESSSDSGKTWKINWHIIYKRKNP
jgi:hypothetical protein